jgi:hypothetical protein
VSFREDASSRRWLAARAMRVPLRMITLASPLLTIAALALIVREPNLAAKPLDVLWLMGLPFAAPFLLAGVYPLVRWLPQSWMLDASGIHGRGRIGGTCPWDALAGWSSAPAEGLPGVRLVRFRRAPAWRRLPASMMVPAGHVAAVEAWLRRAAQPL